MTDHTDRAPECPDWLSCAACKTFVYGKRWIRNHRVCQECGYHGSLTAVSRLASLADPGSVEDLRFPVRSQDILNFSDTKPYPDRLSQARSDTGLDEAVICARAAIEGQPLVMAIMDFRFLGGSLGGAVGELITLTAETALASRVPLLLVTASGGARMQEGAISLMQMAKTSAAIARLDEAGVLTVSLITDPTYGGVAASFATLSDVLIAEPGARLGFAGPRVIQQTIRQQLPPGFQTAEFLLERGFIDRVVPRPAMRRELGRLLRAARDHRPGWKRHLPPDPAVCDPGLLPKQDAWDQVRRARRLNRPTALDYLSMTFTDFQELHGDRVSGDCPSVVGGIASLAGSPVLVIGQQKGHTAAELNQRNFGMPTPAGYRKAGRLMRLAAKLGLPVITLIDTPGACPDARAEEQGQALAIAESIALMTSLPVPVLSVIIGEGGSGGALALAVANRVLMYAGAVYSVISPEGCAAILWHDAEAAPQAARALWMTADALLTLGVVDAVLPEPDDIGADPAAAADLLRTALIASLAELSSLGPGELIDSRRDRFRKLGGQPLVEDEFAATGEMVR